MKWPASIRSRLLLISALTVSLALTLTVTLLVSLFSSNIRNRIDAELTSHINTLAGALSFGADGTLQRPESPLDQRFATPYGGLYWQIVDDARGQTGRSSTMRGGRPSVRSRCSTRPSPCLRTSTPRARSIATCCPAQPEVR